MIKFLYALILIASLESTQGNLGLSSRVTKACEAIFAPKVLSTSCCKQTNQFVQRINECKGKSSQLTTCSQVQCVTTKYNLLTKGNIDLIKARIVLKKLDKIDAVTKSLNALITKYCIKQDYRAFPSKDTKCLPMKFLNCAFYAYRLGCGNVNLSSTCKQVKRNVDRCAPYQEEYVTKLNRLWRTF